MLIFVKTLTCQTSQAAIVTMNDAQRKSAYLRNEVEADEEGTCASSYWSSRERPAFTPAEKDMPLTPPLEE